MLLLYRFFINLIFILSPIIFAYRFFKKKENFKSFIQKIGNFKNKNKNKNLIWFHGASVGEIKSIIPLLEKFEKIKHIDHILITSNTLSSLKIIKQIKLKKVIHQFFPIDTNNISKKFLEHWCPTKAFFIDSEIWPNMIINLSKKKIPVYLINGRITKKSFNRWLYFRKFSNKIFSMIKLCIASSKESKTLMKKLGVKKIKFFGNLKFSQLKNKDDYFNKNLTKVLKKRKLWCASSTHQGEELICGKIHLILKKKYKNLLTVIIPRHIERVNQIQKELKNLNLKVHISSSPNSLKKNSDIYLINSYGITKVFFKKINTVFMGGSLIEHGGQNPLEASMESCNIIHGPNIENFKDIYQFLSNLKISYQVRNETEFLKKLSHLLDYRNNQSNKKKLDIIGKKILIKTFNEIK